MEHDASIDAFDGQQYTHHQMSVESKLVWARCTSFHTYLLTYLLNNCNKNTWTINSTAGQICQTLVQTEQVPEL